MQPFTPVSSQRKDGSKMAALPSSIIDLRFFRVFQNLLGFVNEFLKGIHPFPHGIVNSTNDDAIKGVLSTRKI